MTEDIFCIKCKYDSEFSDVCKNPKGLHKVKTPWRLELQPTMQTKQNKDNNCPWFEEKDYQAKGFLSTVLWQAYKFIINRRA